MLLARDNADVREIRFRATRPAEQRVNETLKNRGQQEETGAMLLGNIATRIRAGSDQRTADSSQTFSV